jgi:hypothetical protein
MNIGYVLTDSGGLTGTTAVLGSDTVSSDYVGTGGADPTAFNFVRNATAYNVTLLFADSGLDTSTNPATGVGSQFGYYLLSSPGTLISLYTPGLTSSPTGTASFNPSGNYGFYDTVCYAASGGVCTSSETYYTSQAATGNNTGGSAWNHFALFQLASGSYVIGFTGQNGMFGEGLGDFQDTVIELTVQNAVPEPGTIAIMGLGLAALGFIGRRRFARK